MAKKKRHIRHPQSQLRVGYPVSSSQVVKREIPVEVFIPEDQFIDYADAFIIHHSPDEFIISFLQMQYPISFTQEQLDKLKTVESACVARIALTPKRLQLLIEALQTNLTAYVAENTPKPEEDKKEEDKR